MLELEEDTGASGDGGVSPGGKRFLGRGDCSIEFLWCAYREPGDNFLGGWVVYVYPLFGFGVNELAIYKELDSWLGVGGGEWGVGCQITFGLWEELGFGIVFESTWGVVMIFRLTIEEPTTASCGLVAKLRHNM